jgi:MarR family transcriptional regulator, temperature-dependent positive regulator of motility
VPQRLKNWVLEKFYCARSRIGSVGDLYTSRPKPAMPLASTFQLAACCVERDRNHNGNGMATNKANANQLAASPLHMLHRASQCAGDVFLNEFGSNNLTPRQFAVLKTVFQNEGISQTGMIEHTGVDRSTMADIVQRMVKKGLLHRRRSQADARAYVVKITDRGRTALKVAETAVRLTDDRILNSFVGNRDQFVSNLATIVGALSVETRESICA